MNYFIQKYRFTIFSGDASSYVPKVFISQSSFSAAKAQVYFSGEHRECDLPKYSVFFCRPRKLKIIRRELYWRTENVCEAFVCCQQRYFSESTSFNRVSFRLKLRQSFKLGIHFLY